LPLNEVKTSTRFEFIENDEEEGYWVPTEDEGLEITYEDLSTETIFIRDVTLKDFEKMAKKLNKE